MSAPRRSTTRTRATLRGRPSSVGHCAVVAPSDKILLFAGGKTALGQWVQHLSDLWLGEVSMGADGPTLKISLTQRYAPEAIECCWVLCAELPGEPQRLDKVIRQTELGQAKITAAGAVSQWLTRLSTTPRI